MKFRKLFVLLFVCLLGVMLVACGRENGDKPGKEEADPLVPVNIALKVKTAKVQINTELKLTYTITPATAQGDKVTVEVDKPDLATVVVDGQNAIKLTAGSQIGTVRVTVKTSNGLSASKTIKVQEEAVESYPDLSGYAIRLAQAEHALGYYDVKLTRETEDKYDYYDSMDRDAKSEAWDEIEDNYNCTLNVVAYPSDAPWGPSRWQYILNQAQNDSPDYDFYVVPDSQIPGFVAGNAILDLTDWYAQYGQNLMTEMSITAGTYKQRLYSLNAFEMDVYNTLCYNIGLWEQLNEVDPTIIEPAEAYLQGLWDFDYFEEYCKKVQTAMITKFGEGESYYCISGYGSYYWIGLTNASGVKILDTTQLKVSITGNVEAAAAQTLQNIYAFGAMDPSFQVDQSVASWNAGHSLFNSGDLWFVKANNRWSSDLWGEDTRYGFVPFPHIAGTDHSYLGTTSEACIVMAAGRDWAYRGFGEECTGENIYRAVLDYYNTAKKIYQGSDEYDKAVEVTTKGQNLFGSEASIKAYVRVVCGEQQEDGSYIGGVTEYGFYEPFVSNSNSVCGNVGGSGTFPGSINEFIKSTASSQWIDAVGVYADSIEKSLVESFG